MKKILTFTLLGLTIGQGAHALELGAPFADHAVLQRDLPVPVWGWSEPGTSVTVEFGGQQRTATAGQDGRWTVELGALEASAEPREMTIAEEGGESRSVSDLLVGEVWMASGQSNMQWIASKSSVAVLIDELEESGETPPIREFEVTSVYSSLHPIERATGEWKDGNFGNYSAIALAFALKLHGELGVPIGILNCSFSQTSIEAWVPRQGFAGGTDEYTDSVHRRILETDPTTPEHEAAWQAFYKSLEETVQENAERVAAGQPAEDVSLRTPGNMSGNRDASWMFNGRMAPVVPYAIRGAIWNQGYASMGAGLRYYQNLHSLVRGWRLVWDDPDLPVYFNQFYSPGRLSNSDDTSPSIGSTAEMRLGTWLARDIPHTGMASQIDIEGAIHYRQKTLSGRRLALHALKNQYDRDVVADGPMFESYTVEGDEVIVEFDHAEGGLVVAETLTNSSRPSETSDGLATPKIIPDGASRVNHFYLAGEDRVWHPASIRIDGTRVIVTSPEVEQPLGVSYGTGGIGFRPGLYNEALLPATPFICFDGEMVLAEDWPDPPLKVAGVEPDEDRTSLPWLYRRLPLLSTQFREDAILQADRPVTVFGGTQPYPGYQEEGEAEIHFRFGDVEKVIPVTAGMEEWSVTLPAHEAGEGPYTLSAQFLVDGELIHERVSEGIVFGDVWYVATPPLPKDSRMDVVDSGEVVRVIKRQAKRRSFRSPSRFSVAVSSTPLNRFASYWHEPDEGFAAALGHTLAAKSGRPTGIILMEGDDVPLSHWMSFEHLKDAPGLQADYKDLAQVRPGNDFYDANVQRYIEAWKTYWDDFIPEMIATRAVPDGSSWGSYPSFAASVTTKATQTHNVLTASFVPGNVEGILFLAGPAMVEADQGASFGPKMSALANGYIDDFGGEARFVFTMPDETLAPKISAPEGIEGESRAVEIEDWNDLTPVLEAVAQ